MDIGEKYLDHVLEILEEIRKDELENIKQAASLISKSILKGGRFYVFGSGHSHMIAEELYTRAGGFALVRAILPPELMLHEMANKSTGLERLQGYAKELVDLYKLDENDSIMVVSNSGRNPVPVEMCLESKKKGAKVVAMCSMKHSKKTDSRDASGKKMYEIADVTIDNHGEKGDAAFQVEGASTTIGPTSTITGSLICHMLMANVVEQLLEAGFDVPLFKSSNLDGADEYNRKLFEENYGFWK